MPLSEFQKFFTNFFDKGLEYFRRFHGFYAAEVIKNNDPENRGRIQIKCEPLNLGTTKDYDRWIEPCTMSAGPLRGVFFPPEVGDFVRIAFKNGDVNRPDFYIGGWHAKEEIPVEFAPNVDGKPTRKGFITRQGHAILFSDEPGEEYVKILWHKPDPGDASVSTDSETADRDSGENSYISFDPDGSIMIANKNGSLMRFSAEEKLVQVIDETGNSITMDSQGITAVNNTGNYISLVGGAATVAAADSVSVVSNVVNLKAGAIYLGEGALASLVKGEDFLTWVNSHVHGTGVGPSSPPTVPAPPTVLSTQVKVL